MAVLVVKHVPWEGPHRIADAFAANELVSVSPLAGEPLPPAESVDGAIFMGGPMSVNDTAEHPSLAVELSWIERALEFGLPLLGICLGSQLIARALGAEIGPASRKELGWATVEIHDPEDPLLALLAPAATVLHWHGEEFATPPGATRVASSAQTDCQAFRAGNAWGLLFHPEADRALIDLWLGEPLMAAEAEEVLGPDAAAQLAAGAEQHEQDLTERSTESFAAFRDVVYPDA